MMMMWQAEILDLILHVNSRNTLSRVRVRISRVFQE